MKFGPGTVFVDGRGYKCSSFEIEHAESFQINGKEIDPARVEIKRVNGVVHITVHDSADFFTRQEDAARKEQVRRNKRPAWKSPYGPQRR